MIGGIAFRAPAVKYFVLKAPILKADYINKRATHLSKSSHLLLHTDFIFCSFAVVTGAFTHCQKKKVFYFTMSKNRFFLPASVRYTYLDLFNRS